MIVHRAGERDTSCSLSHWVDGRHHLAQFSTQHAVHNHYIQCPAHPHARQAHCYCHRTTCGYRKACTLVRHVLDYRASPQLARRPGPARRLMLSVADWPYRGERFAGTARQRSADILSNLSGEWGTAFKSSPGLLPGDCQSLPQAHAKHWKTSRRKGPGGWRMSSSHVISHSRSEQHVSLNMRP